MNLQNKIAALRRQLGDTCLLEELLDSLEQEELQAIIDNINELWGYENAN